MSGTTTGNGSASAGLDWHSQRLQNFCRICGGKFKLGEKTHPVLGYKCEFQELLDINVDADHSDIHPLSMCHACYCDLIINKKKLDEKIKEWTAHPRTGECEICLPKKRNLGRKKKEPCLLGKNLPIPKPKKETTRSNVTGTSTRSTKIKTSMTITETKSQKPCNIDINTKIDHTYSLPYAYHLSNSLTQREREIIAKEVVEEKLKHSVDGATITFTGSKKTQTICTRKIALARKPTSTVQDTRTQQQREKNMRDVYLLTHMEDEEEQKDPKEECSSLYLDNQDISDLKSMMGISWRKLGKLKNWLRQRRVRSAGQNSVRTLNKEITEGKLKADLLPLQHWNESNCCEIRETPFISVQDLPKMVTDLLDDYDELGELTFHDRMQGDVWIKLGGDKGGDTFKLMLQVGNLHHPNSLRATNVIGLFPGKDTPYNLDVTLSSLAEQVDHLRGGSSFVQ